jgi:molybdate transport system substrate-binding protein
LTDAFTELTALASTRIAGRVQMTTAASGVLEAQIRSGAPVDVFAAASVLEPERLYEAGLVRPPIEFARNSLQVAVRPGLEPIASFAQLTRPDFERIAIGSPETVPSGRYARQSLNAAGLLPVLEDRLIPCENVRQALVYVERGEVDAALLYRTDVLAASVRLDAWEVPDSLHTPIRYLACISIGSPRPEASRRLLDLLLSADGQEILRQHGFRPPGQVNE